MTEADRWRTCNHPELVRVRRPDVLPTLRTDQSQHLRWVITPRMHHPPIIVRCTACGQVGEKAVNGS